MAPQTASRINGRKCWNTRDQYSAEHRITQHFLSKLRRQQIARPSKNAKSLDTMRLPRSVGGTRMNMTTLRPMQKALPAALLLAAGLSLLTGAGCQRARPQIPTSPAGPPLQAVTPAPPPEEATSEKRLQQKIDLMQEQIGLLSTRMDAMAKFHGPQMSPEWAEKVQAARAGASRPAERMRYLEATKALLARKLQALQAERKVYEEFELSDPSIPRP